MDITISLPIDDKKLLDVMSSCTEYLDDVDKAFILGWVLAKKPQTVEE